MKRSRRGSGGSYGWSRSSMYVYARWLFFFQAEDGIRDHCVTGVQTCVFRSLVGQREEAEATRRRRRLARDHQAGDTHPGAVGEVADGGEWAAAEGGELLTDEGEQVPSRAHLAERVLGEHAGALIHDGQRRRVGGHLEERGW